VVALPVPLPFTLYLLAGMLAATPLLWLLFRLPPSQAGWRWHGWPTLVLGLGWGGLLATGVLCWLRLLGTGVLSWLRVWHGAREYLPIPIGITPMDWLVVVLLAPVAEELCLRGALLGALQRRWSPFWAIMLSAAADGLVHASQPWTAIIFLAAVGYGLAFASSGSVITSMLAHAITMAVLLLGKRFPAQAFALPAAVLAAAAAGSLLLILIGAAARRPRA